MTLEDSVDALPGPGRWVRGAGAGRAGGLRAAAAAAAGASRVVRCGEGLSRAVREY